MADCGRCSGKGAIQIRLGRPDPGRDTHSPYGGPWCMYPTQVCPVCIGMGFAKAKRQRKQTDGLIVFNGHDNLSTNDMMKEVGSE